MSSVIIAGNTSGTITLDAPNVAGTTTLTLPTTSGTFITTTSPKAGNVIQVVNTTAQFTGNYFSTGSTSLVSTGVSVSITPQFSSSKIFLIANAPCGTSTSGVVGLYTIYRNSTNLATGTSPSGLAVLRNSAGYMDTIVTMSFLDSPSTTSSTTYTVYMSVNSGSATFGSLGGHVNSAALSFTAMEIAA
jgi:hypothetical protein